MGINGKFACLGVEMLTGIDQPQFGDAEIGHGAHRGTYIPRLLRCDKDDGEALRGEDRHADYFSPFFAVDSGNASRPEPLTGFTCHPPG
jgi:hypothetical protein